MNEKFLQAVNKLDTKETQLFFKLEEVLFDESLRATIHHMEGGKESKQTSTMEEKRLQTAEVGTGAEQVFPSTAAKTNEMTI